MTIWTESTVQSAAACGQVVPSRLSSSGDHGHFVPDADLWIFILHFEGSSEGWVHFCGQGSVSSL